MEPIDPYEHAENVSRVDTDVRLGLDNQTETLHVDLDLLIQDDTSRKLVHLALRLGYLDLDGDAKLAIQLRDTIDQTLYVTVLSITDLPEENVPLKQTMSAHDEKIAEAGRQAREAYEQLNSRVLARRAKHFGPHHFGEVD